MPYFDVKSPKRGARLRLDAPFFVIGRGERIAIFQDDPSISREHAAIVVHADRVRVRDLGSRNGVLLNGEPIGRYAETDVRPGDSLRVGATLLVLREGEPPVKQAPASPLRVADAPRPTAEPSGSPSAAPDAPRPASDAGERPTGEAPPVDQTGGRSPPSDDDPVEDLSRTEDASDPGDPSASPPGAPAGSDDEEADDALPTELA